MAESIAELRRLCQTQTALTDSFYVKHVARKCSIYLTSLLIRTPISANQRKPWSMTVLKI